MASVPFAPTEAPTPHRRSGWTWVAWLSLSLAVGALLHALRAAVILFTDRPEPQPSHGLVQWHLALTAVRMACVALAAGAIGTTLAFALARRALFATVLSGAVFLVALTGWLVDRPTYVLAASGTEGRTTLALLAVLALLLALGLVTICRRIRNPDTTGRFAFGPTAVVLAALFAFSVPALVWMRYGRNPPVHRFREVVREILFEPTSWTVVSCPPEKPPHVGVVTPALDWSLDGGDLPALVMPPPCEVRFEVRPEDGPVHLRTSAGVGHGIRRQLLRAPEGTEVQFEILVNGTRQFGASVSTRATDSERVWRHAGGPSGLPLVPGDVVTLRTSLSPAGVTATGGLELPVGFGRLELESIRERPFVPADEESPSIVLILMDTLRADALSCYGNASYTTPALDSLAARGTLYERAYATSSWTWPSTASILTGLWPEAHAVVSHARCYLDRRFDTLGEILGRANFTTAAFTCNPLLDPSKGFDQGFETFEYSRDFRTSDTVLPDIETWIARHADTRFFLYLHLVDPHRSERARPADFARVGASVTAPPGSPAEPVIESARVLAEGQALTGEGRSDPDLVIPPERQRWIADAYAASVLSADHYVGEVLRALEKHGMTESTLVVFTSDHGEELFDHGHLGHGHSLHQELVRAPLILAGPGAPRGARSDVPVSNRHLFETLASFGGAGVAALGEGVDLLAPADVRETTLFFSTESGWWWNHRQAPIHGVQDWPWVLHVAPQALPWGATEDTDPGVGQVRLYDLANDPQELRDRAAERPDLVLSMRQRWMEHAEIEAGKRAGRAPGAGEATLDMLRRFGYTAGDK